MDSSDSDLELPKKAAFQTQDLGDNAFLQLYRQQNEVHCLDREKAINLVRNLKMPKKQGFENNPYLNKNKVNEDAFEVNMKLKELAELQQEEYLPQLEVVSD